MTTSAHNKSQPTDRSARSQFEAANGTANAAPRQHAMRVFALSATERLEAAYERFKGRPEWQFVRRPETGLVMVRGRTGGGGAPFNLGEMSVTRAAVSLASGEVGHAYVQGRDQRKAAIAAFFDAAIQNSDLMSRVEQEVVQPLASQIDAEDQTLRRQAQATKVDFFTVARGED